MSKILRTRSVSRAGVPAPSPPSAGGRIARWVQELNVGTWLCQETKVVGIESANPREDLVWVAEGGVSDFTAEVLRSVQAQRPELNTADFVHVVHHSGTSIERTLDDDLELIEREADLVRINDGNGANGTADLHQFADGFEGAARSSDFSDGWEAAFDLLPADDLDFSDTVTALYLLGIGTDLVADPQDFQAQFLG